MMKDRTTKQINETLTNIAPLIAIVSVPQGYTAIVTSIYRRTGTHKTLRSVDLALRPRPLDFTRDWNHQIAMRLWYDRVTRRFRQLKIPYIVFNENILH